MTLKLILLRHAKSSWDDPTLEDFHRPLNSRGRKSAQAIGAWLKDQGHAPEQTLSSSSTRTQETYVLSGLTSDVSFQDSLYHAGPHQIRRILGDKAKAQTVLLIGHNPGIAMLAEELTAPVPNHPKFFHFPTAAALVLTFEAPNWTALKPVPATAFITPRQLLE